jgi:hypothetical protein
VRFSVMRGSRRVEREARSFKRDASGRLIYFPFAASVGRVVPPNRERLIKLFALVAYGAQWAAVLAYVFLAPFGSKNSYAFYAVFAVILLALLSKYLVGSGMERTDQRMTIEQLQDLVPLRQLLIESIFAISLAGGAWALLARRGGTLNAAFVALLIGMVLLHFGWRSYRPHIIEWRRHRASAGKQLPHPRP